MKNMFKARPFWTVLIVAINMAFVITACSEVVTPTAAPTTVPTNLPFPIGKFIKSGTTDHAMMFNDDGTFQTFQGSNVLVHATYSVDGDTFTIKTNEHGCPDVPRSFKYTFDGKSLTFNYIGDPAADPCTARRGDFDNVTYTLVK